MATLHIHADEAGDFNFGPSGSHWYVFAAVWTREPLPLSSRLQQQRFAWLRDGRDLPRFHASSDARDHRDRVIDLMLADSSWQFCAMVVEKARVYPALQLPDRFYPRFLSSVLRFIFRGRLTPDITRVLVYTDQLPRMAAKKEGVEKAIKETCSRELRPRRLPFHVYHHPAASNVWLQVADYCCWSVQRKYEKGDASWYERLRPRLAAPELVPWR